ncbi:MAG: hypothetical protein PHI27_06515 [Eubacteriales bacterium]|nr:hypothetical protein [Eubacteriales bacterium]MDD4512866.1 hypothetical protein [Eubacteriales bacterium]
MPYGACIERGAVVSVADGLYIVRSLTRDGIITPAIPAISGTYQADDTVYFFLFPDGHGAILAAFT